MPFTGNNGPRGWDGYIANDDRGWPMRGVNMYSLVGRFRDARSGTVLQTFYIGDRTLDCRPVPWTPGEYVTLEVTVNDWAPADNTGYFTVHTQLWQPR